MFFRNSNGVHAAVTWELIRCATSSIMLVVLLFYSCVVVQIFVSGLRAWVARNNWQDEMKYDFEFRCATLRLLRHTCHHLLKTGVNVVQDDFARIWGWCCWNVVAWMGGRENLKFWTWISVVRVANYWKSLVNRWGQPRGLGNYSNWMQNTLRLFKVEKIGRLPAWNFHFCSWPVLGDLET